jgi:hypothetical protein
MKLSAVLPSKVPKDRLEAEALRQLQRIDFMNPSQNLLYFSRMRYFFVIEEEVILFF